jgi:hypothetical protein
MKKYLIILTAAIFAMPLTASAEDLNDRLQLEEVIDLGNYEASGITYNSVTNTYYVVDDGGRLTRITFDEQDNRVIETSRVFNDQDRQISPFDFEAVTFADPDSHTIYIGLERTSRDTSDDSIFEVEWLPGPGQRPYLRKTWDVSGIVETPTNAALEGLTFVPDEFHNYGETASGGLFFAGVQRQIQNGGDFNVAHSIYAFDIDLEGDLGVVRTIGIPRAQGVPNRNVSDLFFSRETGILYALFDDGFDNLIEMTLDGQVINNYENVHDGTAIRGQEGVMILVNGDGADVYLASDADGTVTRFSNYPLTYLDYDGDGVDYRFDCNDRDDAVSSEQNYYLDPDGNGLGNSEFPTLLCEGSAPDGYADNNDDFAPEPEPQPEPEDNAIAKDGSFERYGINGQSNFWLVYGGSSLEIENDALVGDYALEVDTLGANGGVQQPIALEPGNSYRLTVNQRLGAGIMKVIIGDRSSNYDFEDNPMYVYPNDNQWANLTRDFTIEPGANVDDFRLVISVRNGVVDLDEITIEEIDPEEVNLISPFSSANWRVSGRINSGLVNDFLVLDSGFDGKGSLSQTIAVEPNTTYALTYDVAVENGQVTPYLIDRQVSRYGDFEGFVNPLYAYSYSSFERVSRVFTTLEGTTTMNVRFAVGPDSEVSLRNIKLVKLDEAPADAVIRDGDMNFADAGMWTNIRVPEVKEKSEGTLHVRSQAGSDFGLFQRGFSLETNTEYELSFDARIVSGSLKPIIGFNKANADFERGRRKVYGDGENWETYTYTFTTVEAERLYSLVLMAERAFGGNQAEAYIDNVVIREVAQQ